MGNHPAKKYGFPNHVLGDLFNHLNGEEGIRGQYLTGKSANNFQKTKSNQVVSNTHHFFILHIKVIKVISFSFYFFLGTPLINHQSQTSEASNKNRRFAAKFPGFAWEFTSDLDDALWRTIDTSPTPGPDQRCQQAPGEPNAEVPKTNPGCFL